VVITIVARTARAARAARVMRGMGRMFMRASMRADDPACIMGIT
jgi:hypothetical protein